MKTLVVDDDFTSRLILQESLKQYGQVHIAVNGVEAVEAARVAIESGDCYDLICLDVMMPEMDGHSALDIIRDIEEKHGRPPGKRVIVVMTTSLDSTNISGAFRKQCDYYLVKPIDVPKLTEIIRNAKLIV
jgi:two-component system chemotaxis response regulator CheY